MRVKLPKQVAAIYRAVHELEANASSLRLMLEDLIDDRPLGVFNNASWGPHAK
jgi:hypothetical protein